VNRSIKTSNFFAGLPDAKSDEVIEIVLQTDQVRIERIVSHGQATPDGQWYDQSQDEWVLVLQGAARLQFEHDDDEIPLNIGDYLRIPANHRHRVSWTDPNQKTLWLGLFFPSP